MAASNSVLNAYTLPAADSMTPAHQDAEPDAPLQARRATRGQGEPVIAEAKTKKERDEEKKKGRRRKGKAPSPAITNLSLARNRVRFESTNRSTNRFVFVDFLPWCADQSGNAALGDKLVGGKPSRSPTGSVNRSLLSAQRINDEIGWEAGIRTPITWSRATCPTVGRPPSVGRGDCRNENL